MSPYLHGQSAASALAERHPISWHQFILNAVSLIRTWVQRRRQRHELHDYLTIDHRAAADIGIAANDACDWADRPFWRP